MIIPKRLANFENIDVATMVCADLELKRIYDQGPKHVPLGVSPFRVAERSNSSLDSEDSVGAIHSGKNSTDSIGASPSSDD
ncbi:hypothetical protein SLA2020_041680 [Shorea laevis]